MFSSSFVPMSYDRTQQSAETRTDGSATQLTSIGRQHELSLTALSGSFLEVVALGASPPIRGPPGKKMAHLKKKL